MVRQTPPLLVLVMQEKGPSTVRAVHGVMRVRRGHDAGGRITNLGLLKAAVCCLPDCCRIMPACAQTCKMSMREMDMMACEDSKKMRRVCKPFRALSWGVVWETHAPPDVHVCALLDEWRRCEPHGDSPQPFIDVMFRQSECKVEVLFLSYIGYARVTRHHACKCLARICLIYRLQGHLSSYSISTACIDPASRRAS